MTTPERPCIRKLSLLLFLNLSIFLLAGCDQTFEENADEIAGEVISELQQELEREAENAREAVGQWIKDQANAIWQDTQQSISEWWKGLDPVGKVRESFGLNTPSLVGQVAFAQTQLDHEVIKQAFVDAYKEYGFWESLGQPEEPVAVYDANLLAQYFEKGDTRSAIIMPDDPDRKGLVAHALPGE